MSALDEQWRLLPASAGPAGPALAHGAALLAGLEAEPAPAVRWYAAREPALVLGSGQKLADIDAAACARAGVPVHRRASGGTAVLFVPGLIMQDIALPRGHPLYIDDVSESYRWLGAVWAEALAALGVPAELVAVQAARADARAADPLLRRACFGGLSPFEVLAGGRKLVGFSQVRRRQGALLQIGVYPRWPGRELADLLALPAAERADLAARLAGRVVGLDELLPAPPSLEQVVGAFAAALARRHGVALAPADWSGAEREAAAAAMPRFAPLDLAATAGPPPSS